MGQLGHRWGRRGGTRRNVRVDSGHGRRVSRVGGWLVVFAAVVLAAALPPAAAAGGSGPAGRAPTVDVAALNGTSHHGNRHQGQVQFRHPGGQSKLDQEKARIAAGNGPGAGTPSAAAPSGTTASPTAGVGWDGIAAAESYCGCYPPDGAVAAGPNDVLATVNTAFKVFDKTGKLLTSGSLFLGDLFAANPDCLPTISDPFTSYDAGTGGGRFILGALTFDASYNSTICIAVTTGADPTATWYVESFPVGIAGDLLDFPHVGIGSDAVYLTGNEFRGGTTYTGVGVYAYTKADMYAGLVHPGVASTHITDPTVDTLWPAQSGPAGEAYFLTADNSATSGRTVTVYRWTSPYTASSFTRQGSVAVTPYSQPPNAVQASPGGPVTTGDARELGAQYFNGTAYGVHTVGCDPGGGAVSCVQWYQVANLDTTPTLVQQGTIAGAGQYRSYPNLAVDRSGNLGIGYALTSAGTFPGIAFSGRLATDPAGTLGPESILKAGEATIDGSRYGDFAGTVLDPDGSTIWHLEEYAKAGDIWGTWVSSFSFASAPPPTSPPPPPPAMSMTLTSPTPGLSAGGSTPVTVTLLTNGRPDTTHTTAVTVTVSSTSPTGTFQPPSSVTVPASQATSTFNYSDTRAGNPTVSASTSAYGGASLSVAVTAGPLYTLGITPQTPPPLPVSGTQPFSASGADRYGNPVGVSPTWSVSPASLGGFAPASGPSTTFSAAVAGSGTVTASSGSVTATPVSVTVTAAAADCQNC